MKFSCNKCETKYSIADEKVRGKVLKIRCKKCENIIILREPKPEEPRNEEATRAVALDPSVLASLREAAPAQGGFQSAAPAPAPQAAARPAPQRTQTGPGSSVARAAAAPRSAAAPAYAPPAPKPVQAPPAPQETEEWYLAIKGQQVGPMRASDVRARVQAGEADEKTYGWRDGMGDWKRLPDIPELKPLLARPPPPPPPVPPPPPGGAKVLNLQEERRKRGVPAPEDFDPQPPAASGDEPPAADDAAGSDPLAGLLGEVQSNGAPTGSMPLQTGPDPKDPFGSVPDLGGAEGPPRESTRMFIAAAGLANRSRKHRIYAAVGGTVTLALAGIIYLDASGIYQIPIVTSVVDIGFAALDVERPIKTRVVDDDEEGMDFSFLGLRKEPKKPKGGPKKPVMPGDLAATGDNAALADALAAAAGNTGGATFERKGGDSAANVDVSNVEVSNTLKAALTTDGRKQVVVADQRAGVKVEARQENKGPKVDTPLTEEQLMKVVGDQKTSLNQCANDAAKVGEKYKGTVKAVVLIGPSGKVKKVTITDPKVNNTRLGECLGRALLRWIFPRFQGEEFEAEIPLKVSVGQ
ncbi:MAG: zinc-ribbon domain-containing protein [Deltaproteobacteria bacterium]|nr:zinc-ribbon domain-containing protein [Deltaproteobacteria bacterium]